MTVLPIRPFWPTLANNIHTMCLFVQRHQQTLIAVVDAVSPSDHAAVVAAFAALNTACTLFIEVMSHVDPNWKPS
jgi:membrane-associated phospholipid phosphatase